MRVYRGSQCYCYPCATAILGYLGILHMPSWDILGDERPVLGDSFFLGVLPNGHLRETPWPSLLSDAGAFGGVPDLEGWSSVYGRSSWAHLSLDDSLERSWLATVPLSCSIMTFKSILLRNLDLMVLQRVVPSRTVVQNSSLPKPTGLCGS